MVEQQQPVTKAVPMVVHQVSDTTDRNGNPQIELSVKFPWTNAQWNDRVWINPAQFGRPAPNQTYNVVVTQRSRKKDRSGTFYDGSYDWMWIWDIVSFDAASHVATQVTQQVQGAPAAPSPTSSVAAPPVAATAMKDSREASIERQVAFKAAVDLWLAGDKGLTLENIHEYVDYFYSVISGQFGILPGDAEIDFPESEPINSAPTVSGPPTDPGPEGE
ncbi:MAG: hypothetical protein GWN86_07035 [Desulfobacterales bacterium]|nr:hypothetical protein [Desulfobacterales bacterium]